VPRGRAWYTAGGHTAETYAEPFYREHLLHGLAYAADMAPGDCGATKSERFEKVVLEADTEGHCSVGRTCRNEIHLKRHDDSLKSSGL